MGSFGYLWQPFVALCCNRNNVLMSSLFVKRVKLEVEEVEKVIEGFRYFLFGFIVGIPFCILFICVCKRKKTKKDSCFSEDIRNIRIPWGNPWVVATILFGIPTIVAIVGFLALLLIILLAGHIQIMLN